MECFQVWVGSTQLFPLYLITKHAWQTCCWWQEKVCRCIASSQCIFLLRRSFDFSFWITLCQDRISCVRTEVEFETSFFPPSCVLPLIIKGREPANLFVYQFPTQAYRWPHGGTWVDGKFHIKRIDCNSAEIDPLCLCGLDFPLVESLISGSDWITICLRFNWWLMVLNWFYINNGNGGGCFRLFFFRRAKERWV